MTDLEFYKGLSYYLIGFGGLMFLLLPFELRRRKNFTNYKDVWLTVTLGATNFVLIGLMLAFRSKSPVFYVVWVVVYLFIYSILLYYRKDNRNKMKKDERP